MCKENVFFKTSASFLGTRIININLKYSNENLKAQILPNELIFKHNIVLSIVFYLLFYSIYYEYKFVSTEEKTNLFCIYFIKHSNITFKCLQILQNILMRENLRFFLFRMSLNLSYMLESVPFYVYLNVIIFIEMNSIINFYYKTNSYLCKNLTWMYE